MGTRPYKDQSGLPGLRGVEHVGFTVPDLEEATRFFIDVIGCEYVYELGQIMDETGDWMETHLNVPPRSLIRNIRFFRCGFGPNFELFEYVVDGQKITPPRNCDVGGHHLAFYVDDFDAAENYLRENGVTLLGERTVRTEGPSKGQTWIYFLAPWGMQLELVSFPDGKGYERHASRLLWHPAYPSD